MALVTTKHISSIDIRPREGGAVVVTRRTLTVSEDKKVITVQPLPSTEMTLAAFMLQGTLSAQIAAMQTAAAAAKAQHTA